MFSRIATSLSAIAETLSSRSAKQIRGVFLLRMLSFVFATITSVVVARTLGPEKKGVFTAALVLPAIVASLLHFGMPTSNVYFLNRSRQAGVLFLNSVVFCTVVSLIALIVYGLGLPLGMYTDYYEGIDSPWIIFLALSTTVLLVFNEFLRQFLQGLHQFYVPACSRVAYDCFKLAGFLGVFFLLGFGVGAMVVVVALGDCVWILFLLRVVLRKVPISQMGASFSQFKQSISYGLRHYLGQALNTLNTRIDLFVLALFLPRDTLGVYSVAVGLSELVNFLPLTVGYILLPRLAKGDDVARKQHILWKCVTWVLSVLTPCWVVFVIIGRWFVTAVYGKEYQDAYALASILMVGTILLNVTVLINKYFSSTGRPELISIARAINLPLKAGVLYVLCHNFGVLGASVAFLTSSLTLLGFTYVIYLRAARQDVLRAYA